MAVRQTILRYFHILNKLRRSPASFDEIDKYLAFQSELQGENFNVSKRQFLRDIKDISSIFDIGIYCNASKGLYQIDNEEISEISERRIEAMDTFSALKFSENTLPFIHFETRKPLGTENLSGLIHAIRNSLEVSFNYQKFWEDEITHRNVEPLALKEFKSRWYVLAIDQKDRKIKSFGLDRLSNLEITRKKFLYPSGFDVEKYYQNCYGIISFDDQELQEIVLSFDPVQGKYIKTMPLHNSQEVLVDNKRELRIRLKLHLTYDLILEILSHGDKVRVIKPEKFAEQVMNIYRKALT